MYYEPYKEWNYKKIYFGDFVSGKSFNGIEFNNVQITTVGGGSLGVWAGDTPIALDDTLVNELIDKSSLRLMKKASEEEKISAGGVPQNEVIFMIKNKP